MMMTYAENRIPVWLSTYDMSKFFDIQRWDDSTVTMISSGVKGELLRLYEAITRNNKMQVLTPAGLSKWFSTKHLTPQGSSYGALVSSLNLDFSVNQVMRVMEQFLSNFNTVQLRSLQFQDDIAKLSTNRQECQVSQEIIAEMIESKQLVLNKDKCKVMVIGDFSEAEEVRKDLAADPIVMAEHEVKPGTEEKYLGDYITNSSVEDSVDFTVQMRLKEVAGPIIEILALAEDIKSCYIGPVSTAIVLWESIIIKKLLNNASSWVGIKPSTIQKLDKVQTNFYKRLLKLPRAAPTLGIWWEVGCLPMSWRIMGEKLKFAQHLEWKDENNLAGRVWAMEQKGMLVGLKDEITKYIDKYQLPPPTRLLNKFQYKKVLKRTITKEARLDLRKKLLDSTKLAYLATWDQDKGPQMTMTDLNRIRTLTRCRISCHFSFSGDFGSGVKCRCGQPDTLHHVRQGCEEYMDLMTDSNVDEMLNSVERSEKFYEAVLARREEMKLSDASRRRGG